MSNRFDLLGPERGRPLSAGADCRDLKVAAFDESYILPIGRPSQSSEPLLDWLLLLLLLLVLTSVIKPNLPSR